MSTDVRICWEFQLCGDFPRSARNNDPSLYCYYDVTQDNTMSAAISDLRRYVLKYNEKDRHMPDGVEKQYRVGV